MLYTKKYLGALVLLVGMMGMASVHAQSTNNNANNSAANVQTNSTQQTSSTNAGVTAMVNSYGATQLHESVNSQVPLSLVGYGSFSQNNCSNALGVGATTKIFSLVFNAPKPEINCQHMVRSISFGREAGLANAMHKPMQAEIQRAISVWESCTADPRTTASCIRMNVIRYVDPQHPDLSQTMPYPHFDDQAIVLPPNTESVSQSPEASENGPAQSHVIPHRPAGWTNKDLIQSHNADDQGRTASKPAGNQVADTSSAALNALPWVQKATPH